MNLNSLLLRLKSDVRSHWYLLGLAFGVPKDILEELESYPREQRLVEVLDYWLRHYHGQPTWQEVVVAQEKVEFHQLVNNTDAHNGEFLVYLGILYFMIYTTPDSSTFDKNHNESYENKA